MSSSPDLYSATLVVPEGFVTVPAHDIEHPAGEVLYSTSFESWPAEWTATGGGEAVWTDPDSSGPAHSGQDVLAIRNGDAASGASTTVSGLHIGTGYTFTAWVRASVPGIHTPSTYIGVGASESTNQVAAGTWLKHTVTFTATATTATLTLNNTSASDTGAYWDDIALTSNTAWTEHIPDEIEYSADLNVVDGSLKMDATNMPYIKGSLKVGFPTQPALDAMDPATQPRLTLQMLRLVNFELVELDADVLITERKLNHDDGTIDVSFASDDAQLGTYSILAPDTTALTRQSSVRSIVNGVLGKIGASLEPGTVDQPFNVLEEATNLATNPSASVDLTDTSSANLTSVVRQTGVAWGAHGTTYRCNGNASAQDSWLSLGTSSGLRLGVQGGHTYTWSGIYHSDSAMAGTAMPTRARALNVVVTAPSWNGGAAGIFATSAQAPNAANTTVRPSVTFTLPKDTTAVEFRAYHGHASTSVCYWTDFLLVEGDGKDTDGITPVAFFDGDTLDAAPGTAGYSYNWTGTAGKSTSTRTPLIARTPDVLRWDVGDTAWQFLTPILSTCGYYLWADENRRFYLTDSTFTVPGLFVIQQGDNLYSASDVMSRESKGLDGQPLKPDGVVCNYTWLDSNGENQWARDTAGVEGLTAVYDFERPYPGPGTAQNILDKSVGRGRVLDITCRTDLTPRPWQTVSITPPFTDPQVGVITSIEWRFQSDEMTVTTAGLLETSKDAWIFVPSTRTWSNTPSVAWKDYHNP